MQFILLHQAKPICNSISTTQGTLWAKIRIGGVASEAEERAGGPGIQEK